jgi:hypothetical protein
MTHVWRHPKYYAELNKLRKEEEAREQEKENEEEQEKEE